MRYLTEDFDCSITGAGNAITTDGSYSVAKFIANGNLVVNYTYKTKKIEAYLAWRSGTQSSLSADHPFRNRPPLIGD